MDLKAVGLSDAAPAEVTVILDQEHDLWLGQTRLSRAQDDYEIVFRRAFCGPSAGTTTWSGQVVLPDSNINPTVPLLAHIKTIHDEGMLLRPFSTSHTSLTWKRKKEGYLSPNYCLGDMNSAFWDTDADFQFSLP